MSPVSVVRTRVGSSGWAGAERGQSRPTPRNPRPGCETMPRNPLVPTFSGGIRAFWSRTRIWLGARQERAGAARGSLLRCATRAKGNGMNHAVPSKTFV